RQLVRRSVLLRERPSVSHGVDPAGAGRRSRAVHRRRVAGTAKGTQGRLPVALLAAGTGLVAPAYEAGEHSQRARQAETAGDDGDEREPGDVPLPARIPGVEQSGEEE